MGSKGERSNSALYRMYSDGAWADYKDIGGTWTSPLAVVAWGEGRLDVVGRGTDMDIWHRAFDSKDGAWQPQWESLGGGPFGSSPVVVSRGPGRLDILAIAQNDSSFYHISGDGNTWDPWTSIGRLPDKARVTPFASGDAWSASPSATTSSSLTPWESDATSAASGSALGSAAVAGIAVGACAGVAILFIAIFLLWRRGQRTKSYDTSSQMLHHPPEVSAHRANKLLIHEVQDNQMKYMPMSHAVADISGLHELGTAEDSFAGVRR